MLKRPKVLESTIRVRCFAERAWQGDRRAEREFFRLSMDIVRKKVERLLGSSNSSEIDDACSKAYLVISKFFKEREKKDPVSYLTRVAFSICSKMKLKKSKRGEVVSTEPSFFDTLPAANEFEKAMMEEQMLRLMIEELGDLDEYERWLIEECLVYGGNISEKGRELGMPQGTAHSKKRILMEKCRGILDSNL